MTKHLKTALLIFGVFFLFFLTNKSVNAQTCSGTASTTYTAYSCEGDPGSYQCVGRPRIASVSCAFDGYDCRGLIRRVDYYCSAGPSGCVISDSTVRSTDGCYTTGGGGGGSTPTPTTAPGGSGGCGSCSSCGHPTSECVLWEGNCVWDPARCAPSGGGSAPQWCLLGRVDSGTFDISTAYFRRGILPDCSRIKVNNCYLQFNPPEADFKVLWTVNDTNVVRIRNAPWGGPIINPSTSGPYYYMYFRPVSAGQTRIYARGLVNGVERCHSSALITITDSSVTPTFAPTTPPRTPTPRPGSTPAPSTPTPRPGSTPVPPVPTPRPTPPPPPSCSISLNPRSMTTNIGQSATLNASISVRNGSVSFVSFSSSNSSIANVVSPDFSFPFNTRITAISPGTVTITGTVYVNGSPTCSDTASFTVSAPSCTLNLLPDPLNMVIGEQREIAAIANGTNGTVSEVRFRIENPSLASATSPDTSQPFRSDITALSIGNTRIIGEGVMYGVVRCQDTSTLNIQAPDPWIQAKEGDVISGTGDLDSPIPPTCTPPACNPVFILTGSGGTPGVGIYGGRRADFSAQADSRGIVSETLWLANSISNIKTDYSYRLFQTLIPTRILVTSISSSAISNLSGARSDAEGYEWYKEMET